MMLFLKYEFPFWYAYKDGKIYKAFTKQGVIDKAFDDADQTASTFGS